MAGVAAMSLDPVQPMTLRAQVGWHMIALVTRSGEKARIGDLQHRKPVDRGEVLRRLLSARRDQRLQIDALAWMSHDLRPIDEAVSPGPNRIGGWGQLWQNISPLIVSD